jgi:hypothetical protein
MPAPDVDTFILSAILILINIKSLLLKIIDIYKSVLVSGGYDLLIIVNKITLTQIKNTLDALNVV